MKVPASRPTFCSPLICPFKAAICWVRVFTCCTDWTTLRSRLDCCAARLLAVLLKVEVRLEAAVRTACLNEMLDGSVDSWETLENRLEISEPISPVPAANKL